MFVNLPNKRHFIILPLKLINSFSNMKFQQKHTLISIEGNIGSGKSTLLKMIQDKYKGFEFIAEPVNEWQCINGDPKLNLLGSFYQDPTRWAYTMQVFAFYSRLKHWKQILHGEEKVLDSKIILSERSIQADKNIFAVNGYKNGLINNLEYALYNNFYDWLVDEIFGKKIEKQIILYLKSDPDICFTRLQKRGRSEEKSSIKLEYLQQLHDRHEDWLVNQRSANTHILTIDGNKEFEGDQDRANAIFKQIDHFFIDLQLEKDSNF